MAIVTANYPAPRVNPEYEKLVPPLRELEYKALRDSIKEKGQYETIKISPQGDILDGYGRFRACGDLKIKPKVEILDLGSVEKERCYAIETNLRRRHLLDFQKIELSRELLHYEQEEAKSRQREAGRISTISRKQQGASQETENKGKAIAKVAEKIDVSPATYFKGLQVAENAPQVLREKVRSKKLSINDAYKQTKALSLVSAAEKSKIIEKMETGKARDVWDAKSQVRQDISPARKGLLKYENGAVDLQLGDFTKICKTIKESSIALILTDLPYPGKFLPLWEKLGEAAARVLKPGGYLVAYSGQMFLPEVLNSLGKHLTYYWQGIIQHSSNQTQIFPRKVRNRCKPFLIYTKGKKPRDHEWFFDLIRGEQGDKELHQWAQGESEAAYLVSKFTIPGETVLDVAMGIGSFLRPAKQLGRKVIGIEIERSTFDKAVALLTTGEKGN